MLNKLNYAISPKYNTSINRWVIDYMIEMAGLVPVLAKDDSTASVQLFYGEGPVNENCVWIKPGPDDLIESSIINGTHEIPTGQTIQFDIIAAVKNLMTDVVNENQPAASYDQHDRLNSLDSYARSVGLQATPIVNTYVYFFRDWLCQRFNLSYLPLFPEGKKSVVILSHDVDDPVKYAMLKSYQLFPKHLSAKSFVLYHMEAAKKQAEKMIKKDAHVNWAFNELMDSEAQYGFSSTFFFAARNKFDSKANYTYDVPYDIADREFIDLFKQMNERKFEVGLHASYYAKNEDFYFLEEVEKLERLAQRKLTGNRHHFWQIGRKPELTLEKQGKAGLRYDSSLAFNDAPGYRRSIALPYYLYDKNTERTVNCLQIPTFMMDSNLMKNPEFGPEEAVNQAIKYIDAFHKIGGVGAIDWHVRTSYPKNKRFRKWGEVYQAILHYLSQQEDIWVTNFETYFDWTQKRQKQLLHESANMPSSSI